MEIKDRFKMPSPPDQPDKSKNLTAKFAGRPEGNAPWLSEEKDKKLKESCKDFESVFTNMMLQSMRKTLPGDSLFGKSLASDIFQSMYDQNIASQVSKTGDGLGLSGMVYRDLKAKITGVHEAPVKPQPRFYREEPLSPEIKERLKNNSSNTEKTEHDEDLRKEL